MAEGPQANQSEEFGVSKQLPSLVTLREMELEARIAALVERLEQTQVDLVAERNNRAKLFAGLEKAEAELQKQVERREEEKLRAVQAEAALDSFLGSDGGKTVIELRAALAERDEEMATVRWLAREAIAATWPVRPSDETIESEYQELLADARRGLKP